MQVKNNNKFSKYPFGITKLYKKIQQENSYLAKYFFSLDLYDSILNYLYFLAASFLDNSENNNIYGTDNSIKRSEKSLLLLKKNGFNLIPELTKIIDSEIWVNIKSFYNSIGYLIFTSKDNTYTCTKC